MAKFCANTQCGKEIPTNAVYCAFCGTQQEEDIHLSEEERMRKEIAEMRESIQVLNRALAESQKNTDNTLEKTEQTEKLNQLISSIEEREKEILEMSMASTIPNQHSEVLYQDTPYSFSNKGMFKRPFSFKGRIRRLEYFLSNVLFFIFNFQMEVNVDYINDDSLLVLLYIPFTWFIFAQGAKRCHDLNNSGWYQIIPFYILWMVFAAGDSDYNRFGDPPK